MIINPSQTLFNTAGGDNANINAYSVTGQQIDLRSGTAAVGDSTVGPVVKISRTLNLLSSQISGGDGADQAAALSAITLAGTGNQVQPVGIYGGAKGPGFQVGLYGTAVSNSTALSGAAQGVFASGYAQGAGTRAQGGQFEVINSTGTPHNVITNNVQSTAGLFVFPNGANKCGVGIDIVNSLAGGPQFDVGLHFNAVNSGAAITAAIQDDSAAATSLLINGTHATAAIAIAAGAGPMVINQSGAPGNVATLLQITGPAADARPILYVGSGSRSQNYGITLANSGGAHEWFVAANAVLTGVAAGDAGIRVATASKFFHIGGTVSTIKVGNANTLSFFNAAAVAQQTAAGNTHTVAAGATTSVFTNTTFDGGTGVTAYTIGDVILALKNYGLLTA